MLKAIASYMRICPNNVFLEANAVPDLENLCLRKY